MQGFLPPVGRYDRFTGPRRAERRVDAAYPARPAAAGATRVDDILDAEVLWEDGDDLSTADARSPFTFARSPEDFVRAYGARPMRGSGRFVDLFA